MKKLITALLPESLLRRLRAHRENRVLGRLPPVACDYRHAAAVSPDLIRGVLEDRDCAKQWQNIDPRLSELGVRNQQAGVNPGDQRALFHFARALNAKAVLEVGTHIGSSTSALALGIHGADRPRMLTVDLCDVNDEQRQHWRTFGALHPPRTVVDRLDCGFVEFVQSDSVSFLADCTETFDLIFLDGDHSALVAYQDIALAAARLNRGGFVLLHDYYHDLKPIWPEDEVIFGPRLAALRVLSESPGTDVLPVGSFPWPSKQGSHATSLAIVGSRAAPTG